MAEQGYILVDAFKDITNEMKFKQTEYNLNSAVINYQYGYVQELVMVLQQMSKAPKSHNVTFPLVWVKQPFTIRRDAVGFYGKVVDLEIFICMSSEKTWLAQERMTKNFKPILYPLYNALLSEIHLSSAFSTSSPDTIIHEVTDFYWWGEQQQAVLNDAVDCVRVSGLQLDINVLPDCLPFKSLI